MIREAVVKFFTVREDLNRNQTNKTKQSTLWKWLISLRSLLETILLKMVEFCFFQLTVQQITIVSLSIPLSTGIKFAFTFSLLWIVLLLCIGLHVAFSYTDFTSFRYVSRSGLAESDDESLLSCQCSPPYFSSGCPCLHSNQQLEQCGFFPHLHASKFYQSSFFRGIFAGIR